MPLYDYHCVGCDELFEAIRPVSMREKSQTCPSCANASQVFLVMTGFASIATKSRWEPASDAERLAGASVRGPGAVRSGGKAARGNVLHACAGKGCAYCG
jgi:putative FmdB family regulatory protein